MSTLFTKIISGEIPSHKVAESEDYMAFMDINPLAMGHVLVIPKKETDYLFDMSEGEYSSLWIFAQIVAKGIKQVFPCRKVGVAVVGLEVAHAHIHLIPINQVSDMDFSKEKLEPSSEELAHAAEMIRHSILTITSNES